TDHLKFPLVRVVGTRGEGAITDFYDIELHRIQYQKRVVNGTIYDESIDIDRILNYSDTPRLRQTVPELIETYHTTKATA
ncbi:MAG: hypothetical protein ABEK50_02445, partial [bacterium]